MRSSLFVTLVLATGACSSARAHLGAERPVATPPAASTSPPALAANVDWGRASCVRRGGDTIPQRASLVRQGSSVALVRTARGALQAYVADADSRSIHTVSVDQGRELVRTRVGGAPRELIVLADGRLVASMSDGARVEVFEPSSDGASLTKVCEREVPPEPWGLALSPSDADLVVTSGWGASLSILDGATLTPRRTVALPRDPRDVIVSEANVAFVSHLVGAKMSAVDLAGNAAPELLDLGAHKSTPLAQLDDMLAKRTGAQGFALAKISVGSKVAGAISEERVLAPMVSVDPGDPTRRAQYYGPVFDGVPKEAPFVAVVDAATKVPLGHHLLGLADERIARECLLPRAAASVDKTASLLVTCFGIDALLELDALAVDPFRAERRRISVPAGPEGVAVDEASGRAVIFSQMGGAVAVVDLAAPSPAPRVIALDYHPDPALALASRGRLLFYRTDDVRIASDGLACASCHIDGRDDAITWATPLGPRQTPMLAGRIAATAPYGWTGERPTLHDYISSTVTNLGGKGITPTETRELASFLATLKGPPVDPGLTAAEQEALAARGRSLFEGGEQGCSTCHAGSLSTDTSKHDMGPHGLPIDTPSLRFVRGTAPYFHDGRYATLEELLGDTFSAMGHTASIPGEDRAALAAYLRSM